jgi:PHP family Zn ribbon phosphoesterase
MHLTLQRLEAQGVGRSDGVGVRGGNILLEMGGGGRYGTWNNQRVDQERKRDNVWAV